MNKLQFKTKKSKILVVGDLMVDQYFHGEANRISPEAPTPVIKINHVEKRLGGASNVVNNLANLGSAVSIYGIIGDDDYGNFLKKELQNKKVDVGGLIVDKNRKTTVKNRVMVGHHQMLRFDEEKEEYISDYTTKKIIRLIIKNIKNFDCIIISDYDKGVISEKLVSVIKNVSEENNKIVVVDPKRKHHHLEYGKNSIIKTNIQNALILASKVNFNETKDKKEIIKMLCKINNTNRIILTLGKEGMLCFDNGKIHKIKNTRKNVFDVTGAGDVALAVFAFCFLSKNNFVKSCTIANKAAGIKVGHVGTYAPTLKELKLNLIQ